MHAAAGLEGSWGDVDFSDDEFACDDDDYSTDLDDVFATPAPTSRDSISVFTQADSDKFAPDIEDLVHLMQEGGADAGADRRGSDSSLSSHESSGSYCIGGGRGARRRASSIHMMACRWDIGMDDAIELCAAFEAQQGAGCG